MWTCCALLLDFKHKAIPFFCTVPGGMTAMEKAAWIIYGGGYNYGMNYMVNLEKVFGNTGVQMGDGFKRN